MSDIAPADAPANEPAAEATAANTAPAADASHEADIPGIEALPESWQREIKKLRAEAAEYRTSAKPFKEVFDGWSESDRDVILTLARTIAQDPKAGADYARQLAEALTPAEAAAVQQAADDGEPMTAKQIEQMLEEREAKRRVEDDARAVQAEAEALGYQFGTRPYYNLLRAALHEHGGSIAEAHKALEAETAALKQAAIDEFLASKRQDAETLPTAGSGGSAPSNSTPPTTWAEASRSARQRIGQA